MKSQCPGPPHHRSSSARCGGARIVHCTAGIDRQHSRRLPLRPADRDPALSPRLAAQRSPQQPIRRMQVTMEASGRAMRQQRPQALAARPPAALAAPRAPGGDAEHWQSVDGEAIERRMARAHCHCRRRRRCLPQASPSFLPACLMLLLRPAFRPCSRKAAAAAAAIAAGSGAAAAAASGGGGAAAARPAASRRRCCGCCSCRRGCWRQGARGGCGQLRLLHLQPVPGGCWVTVRLAAGSARRCCCRELAACLHVDTLPGSASPLVDNPSVIDCTPHLPISTLGTWAASTWCSPTTPRPSRRLRP